ncbi:MAG: hypothetical protein KA213_03595 [Flavobacterium sp.]|nr:hypothetical protein [Flavobacterium sp.]
MKKSLFLYLFIIAVLMNVFTYKYFTSKEAAQIKPETAQENKKMNDSITKLTDQLYDANYFSLEANDRAMNYLNQNDINVFTEKVKQALLAYNDDKAGNKYTDQVTMGEQKFIITKVKLLNHRWIIASYSNGKLWGEVMLKYFIEDDQTVSFEIMNSYLYPEQLN